MDINPEEVTSYTRQYQEAFLKNVETEHCAKHEFVPDNTFDTLSSSNLIASATALGSYQSSVEPYDQSIDDEEYSKPNNVPQTTHGRSNHTACKLTTDRLYLNSPPEMANYWGQINPNQNDDPSDTIEISSTCYIPDITDWWCQQQETQR
jgi:hypothetical protein